VRHAWLNNNKENAMISNVHLVKTRVALAALIAIASSIACEHPAATGAEPQHATESAAAPRVKLLTASFDPRTIHKIEVGDFHFTAGQVAPVHTHAAPSLGYVSKGTIVYQVAGQPTQILKAGDAFFEPVGPQIVHFDNGSQTDEAVFTDFNFERAGEPFIVFPEPPLNFKVDRRTFPTVEVPSGAEVRSIDIYAQTLEPGSSIEQAERPVPVMGYVAEGSLEIRTSGAPRSFAAGQSFDVPAGQANVTLANASANAQTKIVTFEPSP
jgi:quercetin dioxygenase-like cupin family protein